LNEKLATPVKKTEINGRGNSLRRPRNTLCPRMLALTSPTSGGRLLGIIRLRTKATEFSFMCLLLPYLLFRLRKSFSRSCSHLLSSPAHFLLTSDSVSGTFLARSCLIRSRHKLRALQLCTLSIRRQIRVVYNSPSFFFFFVLVLFLETSCPIIVS
jgi:hypothetical protein